MTGHKAWAIGLDYGCYEGQRAPLTLFSTQIEAEAAKTLMQINYGCGVYLVEVPYWPKIRESD